MTSDRPGRETLRQELLDLARTPERAEELARLLAEILPTCATGPFADKYFRFWQERGFHVTPVHFYQPLPDTGSLPASLWERPSELAGVDLNEAKQLELVRDVFPRFRDEYERFPMEPTAVRHEFFMKNGAFEGTDALVLYCMVRSFRPALVLEVGSGFSSRLSARAALSNGNTRLVCIEPYPDEVLRAGFPGLSAVIPKKVQDVELSFFDQLRENDILFIDSSHVVKTGGDV
ncbi:MAG TPA: class I SAM-dependent methyltransferase, partial [Thermoanaerobaculia bacterium]|nr:class I SAM-dependent methyltransferase [Thermoanaerobaculia bacterium]